MTGSHVQAVAWPGRARPRVMRPRLPIAKPVLAQILVAVLPAMILMWIERPLPATLYLFGMVVLLGVRNQLHGQPVATLTVVMAAVPALMLFRNFIIFHSVTALLMAAVGAMLLHSRQYVRGMREAGLPLFLFVGVLYWLLSFFLTGDYSLNMRVLELIFSAAGIVLLAHHRKYLTTALFGLMITMLTMGLAMFSEGTRLGMGWSGGVRLGNAMTYGAPLALLVVLLTGERGRWLGLERRTGLRVVLTIVTSLFLLLSTARGSWLIATAGLGMIFMMERRGRIAVIATGIAGIIAVAAALYTGRGDTLIDAYDRTFSTERSILNRTSGRSDQWRLFPTVLAQSPLFGFGPGTGTNTYAWASAESSTTRFQAGHAFQWHALYLHVGVETGLIGLGILLLLLGALIRRNIMDLRRHGAIAPLLGTTGFMAIGMTVIGMDAVAGLHLGFGLITGSVLDRALRDDRRVVRADAWPMHARDVPITSTLIRSGQTGSNRVKARTGEHSG